MLLSRQDERLTYAILAQLVERNPAMAEVIGLNPDGQFKFILVAVSLRKCSEMKMVYPHCLNGTMRKEKHPDVMK